jgi:hypothetical protein
MSIAVLRARRLRAEFHVANVNRQVRGSRGRDRRANPKEESKGEARVKAKPREQRRAYGSLRG